MMADRYLRRVDGGTILGMAGDHPAVEVFKGIPYAKPPVGQLRWQAPQPVETWNGVRPAQSFGPRCVQVPIPNTSQAYFPPEPESEDCLYLNVWAPEARVASGHPVLVWFHGGSYTRGSGAQPIFNGEGFARRGIVVVTVNFRVGRLGFLVHPELSAESGHGASGNYCLMDQIASLQWVQRNIAAFGGDPGCVTVAGQSSGSYSACYLMVSPLAKGLFHRVIGQSGANFGPIGESTEIGDTVQALDAAERSGLMLAERLGARSLVELRSRSVHEIQMARLDDGLPPGPGYDPNAMLRGRGAFDTGNPVIDGYVLPDTARALFAAGAHHDVPLLTGTTSHEQGFTVRPPATLAGMAEYARELLRNGAARYLELYPAASDAEAQDTSGYANGDRLFTWQNFYWAREQALRGECPAFLYRFSHEPPMPQGKSYLENPGRASRAYHGAEIPYAFGTLASTEIPYQPDDLRLAEQVTSYWANFIRNGDPNGAGLPDWSAFDPATPEAMFLEPCPRMAALPNLARILFWDAFYATQTTSLEAYRAARGRYFGKAKSDPC